MAHASSIFARLRVRRTQPVMTAPEPEWRENLRDTGLMLSGIYQDLRGDTYEGFQHFSRWFKGGLRKLTSQRSS